MLLILEHNLIFLFFYACGGKNVRFDEPQPQGVNNLLKIPKRIQGKYLSSSQYNFLLITDKYLIRQYDYDVKLSIHQLDTNYKIIGDTLFDTEEKTKQNIKIINDTIIGHVSSSDTFFNLNRDIIRKYKGYYFLNYLISSGYLKEHSDKKYNN